MLSEFVPKTAIEYITCFRQIAAMVERAMDHVEKHEYGSPEERLRALNNLAEGIEILASLRGDNGVFDLTRPQGIEQFQIEMYKIENQLRQRLRGMGYTSF
jgi:hypothetical protein